MSANTKETNPKDAVGSGKTPFSTVSAGVIGEIGLAMLEGARKYGRHNYRVAGVRGSVYYDAALRHLTAWWEGQDIDPDSGISHVTKALASLTVLRDSQIQGNWVDDRPPGMPEGWLVELNKRAKAITEKYPNAVDPFTAATEKAKAIVLDAPKPSEHDSDSDEALEDAFGHWSSTGVCGVEAKDEPRYFCTRTKGHEGEHIGVDGPRRAACGYIQRWPAEKALRHG